MRSISSRGTRPTGTTLKAGIILFLLSIATLTVIHLLEPALHVLVWSCAVVIVTIITGHALLQYRLSVRTTDAIARLRSDYKALYDITGGIRYHLLRAYEQLGRTHYHVTEAREQIGAVKYQIMQGRNDLDEQGQQATAQARLLQQLREEVASMGESIRLLEEYQEADRAAKPSDVRATRAMLFDVAFSGNEALPALYDGLNVVGLERRKDPK